MACVCSCGGDSSTILLYACAGAANTGYLADQVARNLNKDGAGAMTCLSGIGADLSGFIVSAKDADKNVVIDGCPVACGKKMFEARQLPFEHYVMTDFGIEKQKTEITQEIIDRITKEICQAIHN